MITSLGDLHQTIIAKRVNSNIRSELIQLTTEVGTGKKSDISASLLGNNSAIASIDRKIRLVASYEENSRQAEQNFSVIDTVLTKINSSIEGLGPQAIAGLSGGEGVLTPVINASSQKFSDVVTALQTSVGGQFVFSGQNSTTPPLLDAAEILESLRIEVAGISDAATFMAVVDSFFLDEGEGFDTIAYTGGDIKAESVKLSSTVSSAGGTTAANGSIRSVLRDLAVYSLVGEGTFPGDRTQEELIIEANSHNLIASQKSLTLLHAGIGLEQGRIKEAVAENQSDSYFLSKSRNEISNVDLFSTATRLEEIQSQLERYYLVISKTSQLNFANFIR